MVMIGLLYKAAQSLPASLAEAKALPHEGPAAFVIERCHLSMASISMIATKLSAVYQSSRLLMRLLCLPH